MGSFSIAQTGAALGAVVAGLQPSRVTDAELVELQQAYADAEVLFFTALQMEPQEHIDFARRFAQINVNRFFTPVEGFAEIAEVRKEPHQTSNIGGGWHTDHSYDAIPAMGSMAYARTLPSSGGDTLFASMTQAFAALSPGLQESLLSLKAVHSSRWLPNRTASRIFGKNFSLFSTYFGAKSAPFASLPTSLARSMMRR